MSRFEAFKRIVESEKLDREIEAQAVADRRRERLQQIIEDGETVFKRKSYKPGSKVRAKGKPKTPPGYVTVKEFARRTGNKESTVLNSIYTNRITGIKDPNGHWAIPELELTNREKCS